MDIDERAVILALTGERSVRAIAARAGMSHTMLERQLSGRSRLAGTTVVSVARAYELDIARALVAAGVLNESDVGPRGTSALSAIPTEKILKELLARISR